MIMLLFIVFLNFVTMCYYVGGSYLANLMDPDKNAFGFTEVFWNSAPFVFVLLTALLPSINIHSYSDLVNLFAESVFDPSMSGDIEEVPNESLPLSPSIEEPSMPVVTEEVPTEGLPLSDVEPLMSGETKEVPTEGLPLSDVEPFMSEETILVFAIVVLVTMDLVVYFLYY